MLVVVVASNILVQHPVEPFGLRDYLTWGAVTYPFAFLVTDLTNRRLGAAAARRVVYWGFGLAVALSAVLATPRIAAASGTAFLASQLLDIVVFDHLRRQSWWRAPLISSLLASAVDTALFFSLAFAGAGLGTVVYGPAGFGLEAPVWAGWALFDFIVKAAWAVLLLVPYRVLLARASPISA